MDIFFKKVGTIKSVVSCRLPIMDSDPVEHAMEHRCLKNFSDFWRGSLQTTTDFLEKKSCQYFMSTVVGYHFQSPTPWNMSWNIDVLKTFLTFGGVAYNCGHIFSDNSCTHGVLETFRTDHRFFNQSLFVIYFHDI